MYKKIQIPKFRIGRYKLNEYELRFLMLEVAKGLKPEGIIVKDSEGNKAIIQNNGSLDNSLIGMGMNSRLTLDLLAYRKK